MNLDPESVLSLITILGKIMYMWPLDSNVCKQLKYVQQVVYFLCMINEIVLTIMLSATIKYAVAQKDYHLIIESTSHIGASIDVVLNLFIFTYQATDLRALLETFTKYVKDANRPKKRMLYKYMNSYLLVYPLAVISYFATIFTFACAPIFSKHEFPLPFHYFSQDEKYSTSYFLIYSWHILVMCQSTISIFICLTIPMLISMITTRLNMLALKIMAIKNNGQLNTWIRKHQKCIRYAETLRRILRFLILKLYFAAMMTVIFGALPILYHQDSIELIRAVLYVGATLLLIYISAWAADDMHTASLNVSQAIYNSDWANMSIKMRKSMIIIMCRAQRPLDISIPGILPPLTLVFYAKCLLYALSYIMTLRAILL